MAAKPLTVSASGTYTPFRPVKFSATAKGWLRNFTGLKGVYVPLAETVKGFAAIVDGQCDDLPEWAFFNVGTLADARKKYADKQAEEKGGAN